MELLKTQKGLLVKLAWILVPLFMLHAPLQLHALSFQDVTSYPVDGYPNGITAADFNKDGRTDIAVADTTSHTISVRLGNGDGTFGNSAAYGSGKSPQAIVHGDVNGDGNIDLITVDRDSDSISVFLGNGGGTFANALSFPVGDVSLRLAVGDFNDDNKLDVAVSSLREDAVYILLGIGDGTFAAPVSYAVGDGPYEVLPGDFNGDGKLDLAVANFGSKTVSVLLGNGLGAFAPKVDYGVQLAASGGAAGDLNKDGHLDLVVGDGTLLPGSISVLLGRGDGTFAAAVKYSVGGSDTRAILIEDFTGDGNADVVTGNWSSYNVSVLAGDGTGALAPAVVFDMGGSVTDLISGDFNGDGLRDLAFGRQSGKDFGVRLAIDEIPPVITLNGANPMLMEAGSVFTDPGATAHDGIDGDLTSQITVSGAVDSNRAGTYTLTYEVTDAAGNLATKTRAVQVVDTVAPVLTLNGPNPMQVEAGSAFTDPGATAQDAADGDLTSQITVSGAVDAGQVGTYTLTYQVTDAAGHVAAVTRTVQVVDTTAPVLTLNGPNPMQIEAGSAFTDPGATAQDAADGDLTSQITMSGAVDAGQVGTYTLTYQVTDAAGNLATKTRAVQVVDTVAPVLTLNGPNPMQMEAGSAFTDPGATAQDAADGDLTSQITVSGAVDAGQIGTYTLTYQVTDAAGHVAAVTRTVQVVDTGVPVITLNGPNPMQVEAGSAFTDPGATAQDAADGDLTSQITVSGAVYAGQVGTYTLTYQVTDAAGHVATMTRTVQVVDTGVPVITLNGPNPMQIEAGSAFTDPGATAQDAADGDLTSQITVSGAVYAGQVGIYTLTYQVTDAAGHVATTTRTVQVVDTGVPVITLNGPNPMQVEAGSAFTDPGATAHDAIDGDLTSQITVSGAVYAGQAGTYTLTYQVTDAAGNLVTKARTVQVVDTGSPVITLNGPNPMQVEAGSAFTDPGATAQDAADGDLTSQITVSGAVYTGQAGTYTLTYQVADAAGHVATKTRTVQVVDLGAPLITLNGPNPMEIEAGSAFTDPGATAHDAIDGDLTSQITVSGAVYANQTGTYTLVYRVRDSSGNAAADVTRTVNVIPQEASSGSSGSSSAERSSNADIALLMLDLEGKTLGLTPVFAPEITHYTAETDAGQVRLRVTLADPGAIVTWRDQPVEDTKIIPLAMGINEIVLKVRAEDGSVKTYTITITRHTVKLTPPSNGGCTFTDIRNHWAEPEICEAAALGIVEGVDAQTFMPDVRVTRTEFAVMLLRTQRIPISNEAVPMPFLDKESIPEWARQAIRTAVAKGVLDGFLDGTLRPQQTVSRAEMAAMLAKSMKWETAGLKDTSFADNASIPAWAKGYVEATRKHGMVEGRDGNQFVPDGRTTRAEAAVVLLRLWKTLH